MEGCPDITVQVKYPNSVFWGVTSNETFRKSEGFGVRGFFPSGTYLLPKGDRYE